MPGLVRKLLIFAAIDGLILQPAPSRNQHSTAQQAVKIDYKGNISPLQKDRREAETALIPLETHGIIGLLKVASSSFLISISNREQVAQIRGKPIYVVTDVAVIPLSSQADADRAIKQASEHLRRQANNATEEESDSDASTEDESASLSEVDSIGDSLPSTPPPEAANTNRNRRTSVAEDVIGKKGLYGRFAERWFSKRGWSAGGRRMQGMSDQQQIGSQTLSESTDSVLVRDSKARADLKEPHMAVGDTTKREQEVSLQPPQQPVQHQEAGALLPKILRTTKLYFGSKSFYFSYEYDLSRCIARQSDSNSSLPLFKLFDPLYFWNCHIITPFIEAGQQSLVLPVIQGFVGQRAFSVAVSESSTEATILGAASKPAKATAPIVDAYANSLPIIAHLHKTEMNEAIEVPQRKDFLLTLISRRSVKRAGLRYLRRGVDEEGNVANSVETEQILSTPSWDTQSDKIYSYLQCRGSIPVFFSQSPYSLKPVPVFWGSPETNAAAFKLHFQSLASRYGGVQAASLVDKHGSESKIGEAFERHTRILNSTGGVDSNGTQIAFEWFDFHHVCRGMKFENVSLLMDTLSPTLTKYGWTIVRNYQTLRTQSGVLRTNCMDCLDRTNVVQSAAGRTALEEQLVDQKITVDLENDPTTSWFNNLWADNGDAISKQYAGTAALKGDFTRTRRRNISGALTDFGLTLSRYYNNIVNDNFAQAVIDYLLGRARDSIFDDFAADLSAQDYAVDLRKLRQAAISRAAEVVIESDTEDLVAGWTLACPSQADSLRASPFEECVLLLTERAAYFCRFDWGTEKVKSFERVNLRKITGLQKGAYITSTLVQRHMDEARNVGFVVRFQTGGREMIRVNTRSLTNRKEENGEGRYGNDVRGKIINVVSGSSSEKGNRGEEKDKFLAFKALPPRSSFSSTGALGEDTEEPLGEVGLVSLICDEIQRLVNASRKGIPMAPSDEPGEIEKPKPLEVEERDIISLEEAKKSTGYFEQLGYSLMKLVWA